MEFVGQMGKMSNIHFKTVIMIPNIIIIDEWVNFLILTFSNVFDKTTNQIVLCKCKKIFDTWLEIGVFETMICFCNS